MKHWRIIYWFFLVLLVALLQMKIVDDGIYYGFFIGYGIGFITGILSEGER